MKGTYAFALSISRVIDLYTRRALIVPIDSRLEWACRPGPPEAGGIPGVLSLVSTYQARIAQRTGRNGTRLKISRQVST